VTPVCFPSAQFIFQIWLISKLTTVGSQRIANSSRWVSWQSVESKSPLLAWQKSIIRRYHARINSVILSKCRLI